MSLFKTTIAGSLPKPAWLAEPDKLWAPWKLAGSELQSAKRDATLLWLKEQEDLGINIVGDGEQSRQHFAHGFLEAVEGIDFEHKVKKGIRDNRYEAMVPLVVGSLKMKGRAHATEARLARAHPADPQIHAARPHDHRRYRRRPVLRQQGKTRHGLGRPTV